MTALPAPRRRYEVAEQPSPHVLRPWHPPEAMTVAAAAKLIGQSGANVRRLAARYDLGRRLNGPWMLSRVAVLMYMEGNSKALLAYHSGDRSSDMVVSYYRRAGIAPPASEQAAQGA